MTPIFGEKRREKVRGEEELTKVGQRTKSFAVVVRRMHLIYDTMCVLV